MGCANFSVQFTRHACRHSHPTVRVGLGRRVQAESVNRVIGTSVHRYIGAACQLLRLTGLCLSVCVTTRNKLILKTRFTSVFKFKGNETNELTGQQFISK
jgi:hypothetical protein